MTLKKCKCRLCKGNGSVKGRRCPKCHGVGRDYHSRRSGKR